MIILANWQQGLKLFSYPQVLVETQIVAECTNAKQELQARRDFLQCFENKSLVQLISFEYKGNCL